MRDMCCTRVFRAQWAAAFPIILIHFGVGFNASWGMMVGSPVIGAIVACLLINFVGRRSVLALSPLVQVSVAVLQAFSLSALASWICVGVGLGLAVSASIVYLSEISSPERRGMLCCSPLLGTLAGRTVSYAIEPYVSQEVRAWLVVPPALLGLLLLFWTPESPYFLALRGRGADMLNALMRLRGQTDAHPVHEEGEDILDAVREQLAGCCAGNVRGVMMSVVLCGSLPLLGGRLIETHASTMAALVVEVPDYILGVSTGIVQLVTLLLCSCILDCAGRLCLGLLACVLCHLAHAGCSAYYYYSPEAPWAQWIPLVCLITFAVGYSIVSTVSWVLMAEVTPLRAKPLVPLFIFVTDALLQSLVAILLLQELPVYLLFLKCAVWSLTLGIFIASAVPETKRCSLGQLHEVLSGPYTEHHNAQTVQTRL